LAPFKISGANKLCIATTIRFRGWGWYFHPDTFLRAIGPEPWNAAHVQSSRRPSDGRYGEHPNRNQHFYQYQVVLKPSPDNIQELY